MHLAQAGKWDEFHAACHKDKPFPDILTLVQLLADTSSVLIVTGRDATVRPATMQWLQEHDVLADEILMRPPFDFCPDIELKIKLLEEFFGSKEQVLSSVLFCLDDRDKVVQGLRDYGLTVLQARQGDY